MKIPSRSLAIIFLFSFLVNPAAAENKPAIPDLLKPWTDWVLYGHEEKLHCSPSYNDQNNIQCDWPSVLDFTLTDSGGRFSQEWLIQYKRWVQLPGTIKNWPHDVLVNNNPAIVLNINGQPKIKLPRGQHTISGSFTWTTIPEYMSVPVQTGIVSLSLNGKNIDFPDLDTNGQLWLQTKQKTAERTENRLKLQSFRLIDDRIPAIIVTSINLDVSGTAREILLGPVLPAKTFIPVEISSILPAKLEPDGKLRVQVRPGQWNLTVTYRHIGSLSSLQFSPPEDNLWPPEEIWVFKSNPSLRVVEVEGVPSIDPLQTSLPEHWRNLPAYRVLAGDTLVLREIKRGDPHPAPDQLTLQRNIWLRFDGSGYTIQDTVTGAKTANWRLEMNEPIQLGRVAVDGREQFITRLKGSEKTGVELRKGLLNLTADSEYREKISSLPVTGWNHDFQKVSARLYVPPGWRLLSAAGVDTIRGTWVKRWTLLDFFIVLIFTIAMAKLFSKPMAGLAFVTLVLIYHEPDAPRWIWIAILAGVAMLRHLPAGKFKASVKVYQVINILVLIGIALPFSINQLRTGLYPQLEKPWQSMISLSGQQSTPPAELIDAGDPRKKALLGTMEQSVQPLAKIAGQRMRDTEKYLTGNRYQSSSNDQVAQYDPSMINQTGPGLPNWQWNTFSMNWSGPVQKDQQISFILTGPKTNLALSFLRVILLVFLILGIFGIRFQKGKGISINNFKTMFAILLIAVVLVSLGTTQNAQAGEIPSPQMLEELRTRLLEKEECFPGCADISTMAVNITPEKLQLTLTVVNETEVSIPLPGNASHWLPQEVQLDNNPIAALYRVNNTLWALLPAGKHTISLTGRLPMQNSLQLPLPLKPHRVIISAEGWTIEGIHENGITDNQIQFKRIIDQGDKTNQILKTGILPPFLQVERTLRLGLNWKIETTIQRIGPTGSAAVFSYPLLAGESIITEGIRVKDNQARLNMTAQQSTLRWDSVIERSGVLLLKHADTDLWTEIWRVDVSPVYHVETSGIPVILHQQGNRWYPTWHPWPGEEVKLTITRPQGVQGQTMTIDKTHLEMRPGQRTTDTSLNLSIKSSQGSQHTIQLPDKAKLQEVLINDKIQPIRQEGQNVTVPIKPGSQEITLKWREPAGITPMYKTPSIDLGIASVNNNIDVHLPQNRWPIFMGGPLMGPAVLFWSVVLVLILVTFGLSRTGYTPLKFHHWFLLGIGMSQSNLTGCLIVAGWLIALDLRHRVKPDIDKTTFNLLQLGIGALTLMALGSLVVAINQGLLGHPDMNIVGNGSNSTLLRWYEDHSGNILPRAWVISLPMFIYRLAMLAWALWLSFYLIKLLKWGWNNFTEPVIWYKIPRKKRVPKSKKGKPATEKVAEKKGTANAD